MRHAEGDEKICPAFLPFFSALAAEPRDISATLETVRAIYKLPACASAVIEEGRIVAIGAGGLTSEPSLAVKMDARAEMREAAPVQMTGTEKALRAHVRSHNGSVLAASGIALVFSTIGWAVLYGASYWLTMFALAVAHQGEANMPPVFNTVFFGTAAVLMLAARVDQFFFPSDRAVDERPPVEHFADVLFFVPRFTMSCWQSLGALAVLSRDDLQDAARLMDHLKTARRVSLQELPPMFPDGRRLHRVLDALLVTGLVDQRRDKNLTWFHLGALAPDVFRHRAGTLPQPEDPLAGVQQVKIRRRVRLPAPREDEREV